ncbi:dTDP-L-rhamnose 4-epimerase [Brevundimonas bullata]|jgi:dTDP-L-rhamnose 4-epimerase|uniref:dTDP-L-rhamnose 4-epimerase n=1 Tax=Brevundimonas bullata TaxID=13160 RepID=A0A7W7N3F6_9CAUL|nr:NAD-dependent epimerase/dehydratase family protein [Brevundimonas bullata]MBB4797284.1 dTDP-L-rhamnose 4-epimerase [Brevundimonas bullata]MBB6382243.1 dTDP-L-rhamnose 4-epimerase [Brevundimonas bullata]
MDKHILITGGAGFIGSHLVDAMLARGYRVSILDNLSPQVHADGEMDAEGWPTYLDRRARRIRGDILDEGVFEVALEGVTHLAHLAASVGVGQSMTNIVDYTRNNVMAAAVMLEVLSQKPHTVERIAVASSMSIYGEGDYIRPSTHAHVTADVRPHAQLEARQWEIMVDGEALEPVPTTEEKLLQPNSIYAVNKRDHEEMFLSVGRALQIPTVALRLFNAYGSRQALSNPYTGVAAIFISRLLNDQPPLVFEDGRQMRDFVHVQDVARAFATVLDSDRETWDVFNVGSGSPVSVNEIAGVLARLLGKNIAPEVLNRYRVGDIRHCFGDIAKIEQAYNFRPERDMETGMEELIAWVSRTKPPVDRSAECLAELTRGKLVV